jgi:hypothetical protein
MLLVRKVITGQTDRPTSRPSDSSDGPDSTEPSSEPDSSSPVAEQAEEWLRVKSATGGGGASGQGADGGHGARGPLAGLSAEDLCDLSYLLQVEQIERRVLADRQALIARGLSENLPTFGVEQAAFNEWLVSEPERLEPMTVEQVEKSELLRSLGVA